MQFEIRGSKAGKVGHWKLEALSREHAEQKARAAGVAVSEVKELARAALAAVAPSAPVSAAAMVAPPAPAAPEVISVPPVPISYAQPQPQAPVQMYINAAPNQKGTSGFGIAALIIGIIAVLVSWVPLLGVIAIPIGAIGLLIGVIGFIVSLAGGKSGVGMPVAGCTVCILALGISVMMTIGTVHATAKASSAVAQAMQDGMKEAEAAQKKAQAAEASEKARRESLFPVQYVRPTGEHGFGTELELRLINHTGKRVNALSGALRIEDEFGDDLDNLKVKQDEPVLPGGQINQKATWVISDRATSLLTKGKAKLTFEPQQVIYSDGSREAF